MYGFKSEAAAADPPRYCRALNVRQTPRRVLIRRLDELSNNAILASNQPHDRPFEMFSKP